MDGRQGAGQPGGRAQFLEGQVGLFRQQRAQLMLMTGHNAGLVAGTVVLGAKVAQPPPLLEEFLDHTQGDAETSGHRLTRVFVGIVGGQNPFAQIQGDSLHPQSLPHPE
jgi:hypothetical protein